MHWDGMSASEAATIKNWPKVGQDTDTLSEYDLTMEDVILAAERTQDIAHGYQVRDPNPNPKITLNPNPRE